MHSTAQARGRAAASFPPQASAAARHKAGRIRFPPAKIEYRIASWMVPIPAGAIAGEPARTMSDWFNQAPTRILQSAAISSKPSETPIGLMQKAARDFKRTIDDPKIQQEVKRSDAETYLRGDYALLDRYLIQGDRENAVAEIVSMMKEEGKTPQDFTKYYSNLPLAPFTGSRMLDQQWIRGMAPPQRKIYQSAIVQRQMMGRSFFVLWPYALQAYRQTGQPLPRSRYAPVPTR